HGGAHQRGIAVAPAQFCRVRENRHGEREVLQPRAPLAARANPFRARGDRTELGVVRRCRGVGRPADRRRIVLRDALWRLAGTRDCGRMPGEISGAGAGVVLGGVGICGAHRKAILPGIVPGLFRDHADGAVLAAECDVPAVDERFVLRDAGLHDVETASAGTFGRNAEPICIQRIEFRPASGESADVPGGGLRVTSFGFLHSEENPSRATTRSPLLTQAFAVIPPLREWGVTWHPQTEALLPWFAA